ncbi:MAG: hypothetical protein GXO27_06270 [Chlorobi bacterium]|nr:hypothetical protein [Chlorobiota bacterium]
MWWTLPPFLHACRSSEQEDQSIRWWLAVAEAACPPDHIPWRDWKEAGLPGYLQDYLSDPRVPERSKRLLRRGLAAFRARAREAGFWQTDASGRERFLKAYIQDRPQREQWLARFQTLLFEVCFLDPLYGVNRDMKGWRWTDHYYGRPRPDRETSYRALAAKWNRSEVHRS